MKRTQTAPWMVRLGLAVALGLSTKVLLGRLLPQLLLVFRDDSCLKRGTRASTVKLTRAG